MIGKLLPIYSDYEASHLKGEHKCLAHRPYVRHEGQNNPFLSESHGHPRDLVRLQPGQNLIDRFNIIRFLGNGSVGSVYLAKDLILSMDVALKVVEVGPLEENNASLKLRNEMNAQNSILDHRHIIRVYDLHFVPWGGTGLLLLSMEYADGGTLKDWLIENLEDLDARRTVGMDYFRQACEGVMAIHDSGSIHLDLKPTNLLFSKDILKVSDFGSARYTKILNQTAHSDWRIPFFEEGTPIYRSPEQVSVPHPDDLDVRADIYALGIILFELLHPKCRPPFLGSNQRLKRLHAEVPAPQLAGPNEDLAPLVARCLEKDPSDRYQSVMELLQDLDEGRFTNNSRELEAYSSEDELARRIEETWEKASLWFSKGDFNEAKRLTEEVLFMVPDHQGARYLRKELATRFDQAKHFYEEIERNLNGGPLSNMLELAYEAVNIYPDHPSGRLVQIKLRKMAMRFRQLWENISSCLSKSDFHEALELLEQVLRIEPDDKHAKQLKEQIREKVVFAEQAYEEIERNLDSGEFLQLTGLLHQAITHCPNHPKAPAVQAKLRKMAMRFRQLWENISSCLSKSDFHEALELLEQVLRIEPDDKHAKQLKEQIREKVVFAEQAYEEIERNLDGGEFLQLTGLLHQAGIHCPNHPKAQLVQAKLRNITRNFKELWEKISACYSQNDLSETAKLLEEIIRLQPGDLNARKMKEIIEQKFTQAERYLQTIEANLERGNLPELVGLLREADRIWPNHPSGRILRTRIKGMTKQFRKAIGKGIAALNQRNWNSAFEWFNQAHRLNPMAAELMQVIEPLSRIRNMRQEINQAVAEGKYDQALRLAQLVDFQASKLQ